MRVRLETLGCRLNEAEVEAWARQLERHGVAVAAPGEAVDLVILNTCAVTTEAQRKSRNLIARLRRDHPEARMVVSGCAVSLPGQALPLPGAALRVANADKDRLVDDLAGDLGLPAITGSAAAATTLHRRGRQRAFIKVQDGCRYRCTFCITSQARGAERSRSALDVCAEINALAADGIAEVVLTGVHLGGYGSDSGSDLASLIAAVLRETDVPRIRLGSLEPRDLPEALWPLFANPRLMPHLHLPVQSGSDAVLRRMARRCSRAAFLRLVDQARAVVPDLTLGSDIICGFPGETFADWQATLDLVARVGFAHLHVFPYSPRPGTLAAGLPGQVQVEVRRERARQLQELAGRQRRELLAAQAGRTWEVLIEGPPGLDPMAERSGLTPNYLPVRLRAAVPSAGDRLRTVRIRGLSADGEALLGELVAVAGQ